MGAEVVRLLLKKGEKPVVFSSIPNTSRLADLGDSVEGIAETWAISAMCWMPSR